MKQFFKPVSLLCTVCAYLLFFSSCSKSSSGGGTPKPGGGDVPGSVDENFQPQSPDVLAPYVGVWENSNETVIFTNDGRIAIADRSGYALPYQVGTYHVNNDQSINIEMIFTGHDVHIALFDNNVLTFGTENLTQTATANDAPQVYNEVYHALANESAPYLNDFPVGSVVPGPSDPSDPQPSNVISNAKVYTGNGVHFASSFGDVEWYEMPDHHINGYDSYSRADFWLLPNGRFCSEMWLWDGVDVHDEAHVKHYLSWGKYSVTTTDDPVKGDIVNVVYDNGRTATYRAAGGRRYFRTQYIIYHNWALK